MSNLRATNQAQRFRVGRKMVIALSVYCTAFAGCAKSPKPTPLINGIASRQSVQQIERLLQPNGKPSPIDESMILNTRSVAKYQHLGMSGTLTFFFFKNELVSTTFEPSNFPKYKILLEKQLGTSFKKQSGVRRGDTWIGIGGHPTRGRYALWSDVPLSQEADSWKSSHW